MNLDAAALGELCRVIELEAHAGKVDATRAATLETEYASAINTLAAELKLANA
jgi:hypothetical protein